MTLDKARPAILVTREAVLPYRDQVTVVPIYTESRGLSTELAVGPANGVDLASVANVDNIITVPGSAVGSWVGHLLDAQEPDLVRAVVNAFDLDVDLD